MQKNVVVVLLVLVVVIAGGLLFWFFTKEEPIVNQNNNQATVTNTRTVPPDNTVWIVNGNFNPSVVTVSEGETVTWVNKDEIKRQVASDPHPSHDALPGLVSDELEQGQSFTYTFEQSGEWLYHDNLNPIKKGKVVVE